jgi:hypothetical protein
VVIICYVIYYTVRVSVEASIAWLYSPAREWVREASRGCETQPPPPPASEVRSPVADCLRVAEAFASY